MNLQTTISLNKTELLPQPELFEHKSHIHGRLHVGRVMINGFVLINITKSQELEVPLWASVYLHDLSRQHDGFCEQHGLMAINKFRESPEIQASLKRGGLQRDHWPMVVMAVEHHCYRQESDSLHPYYKLLSLLKDADALDRVRLGDLDPSYLRHNESHEIIRFAEELFYYSEEHFKNNDPDLMQRLWDTANKIQV